jgi:hypothetical protein
MSRAELLRALGALVDPPRDALAPIAEVLGLPRPPTVAEHSDLFTFQLHPYASVHLGPEGQLGGIARDRVAGFLRALGATPPAEPDHLAVLLRGYAQLVDLAEDGADRACHARTVMLHEHLWPWVPRFARRAGELGAAPYVRWAEVLEQTIVAEVATVGDAPVLSAHLREAEDLHDPAEVSSAEFLQGLLAPARSGLIIARADLARLASELGIGLRIGERAFTLRALLAQDAAGTLARLADEADRQRELVPGTDETAGFWRTRLAATATWLRELAATRADTTASG